MKRCARCQNELPESRFYKCKVNKDGLRSYCKACCNTDSKDRYRRNCPEDPGFKERFSKEQSERMKRLWADENSPFNHRRKKQKMVCDYLKQHHEDMKDDPEHLTTKFMQQMVGLDCS